MANFEDNYKKGLDAPVGLEYVTGAQGQIFIGGILVDECYDIFYSTRELKEPIYGYKSKYYDDMLPGTIIVHGQFSINYKHDAYLKSILDKHREDTSSDVGGELAHSRRRKLELENTAKAYKAKLGEIKALRDEKDALKKQVLNAKTAAVAQRIRLENLDEAKQQTESAYRNKESSADAASVAFMQGLSPAEQTEAAEAVANFDDASDTFMENKTDNEDYLNGLNTKRNELTEVLNEAQARLESEQMALTMEEAKQSSIVSGEEGMFIDAINAEALTSQRNAIVLLNQEISNLQAQISKLDQGILESKSVVLQQLDQDTKAMKGTIANSGILGTKTHRKDALAHRENLRQIYLERNKARQVLEAQKAKIDAAIREADTQQELAEKKFKAADQGILTAIAQLDSLKTSLDNINESLVKTLDKPTADRTKRAEDNAPFDIYIYYNGKVHKIIKDCALAGHTHAVGQGGEAIREVYQFIAKEVR